MAEQDGDRLLLEKYPQYVKRLTNGKIRIDWASFRRGQKETAMPEPQQSKPEKSWSNRILRSGDLAIDDVLFNPFNWRIHPRGQQTALNGALSEVGWVQQVVVNETTGHLIDGHLRVQLAERHSEKVVPAVWVSLSEDEEKLVLASLDPIGAMAATDRQKLSELLLDIETENEGLQEFLSELSGELPEIDATAEWAGMPAFDNPGYGERHIILHFGSEEAVQEFALLIGREITPKTRYLWFPPQEESHPLDWQYRSEIEE